MSIIYQAMYCPSIHESGYITLSIHKTKEGADIAIQTHKDLIKQDWINWGNSMCSDDGLYKSFEDFEIRFPFAMHEAWTISETTLLD